ncbi:MAG: hypothetical protein QOJ91_1272 [Sphingomonadales bacterium]|nr:hypothetical protein [Sphingomonadales bacterium]
MSRNLTIAALAILAQVCQQPEQGLGNFPQATASQGREAMSEPEPPTAGTRLSFWGLGAPAGEGPVGGAAARLDGILSRLGGCLVVTPGNGRAVHPVFPAGRAAWDERSQTLRLAGKAYRPGNRITLGGGAVDSPSDLRREAGVELAPCPVADYWVVVA